MTAVGAQVGGAGNGGCGATAGSGYGSSSSHAHSHHRETRLLSDENFSIADVLQALTEGSITCA